MRTIELETQEEKDTFREMEIQEPTEYDKVVSEIKGGDDFSIEQCNKLFRLILRLQSLIEQLRPLRGLHCSPK